MDIQILIRLIENHIKRGPKNPKRLAEYIAPLLIEDLNMIKVHARNAARTTKANLALNTDKWLDWAEDLDKGVYPGDATHLLCEIMKDIDKQRGYEE